jgi:hypothetical protein
MQGIRYFLSLDVHLCLGKVEEQKAQLVGSSESPRSPCELYV